MKENTKFLWMYVGILFSFALILIIFAGLSHNTDTEQTQGLKSDITELSKKNTELVKEKKELENKVNQLMAEMEEITEELNSAKSDAQARDLTDNLLLEAAKEIMNGNYTKFKEIISKIDPESLTEAQRYIYNKLI